MNAVWQQLTFNQFSPSQWRGGSYLYRLVGIWANWTSSSWLWQWSEGLGAILISLVFLLAPFVSTGLIGLLMATAGLFWLLLTLADPKSGGLTPIHLLVMLYWGISAISVGLSPVKMAALVGLGKLSLNIVLFALTSRILRSNSMLNRIVTVILLVGLTVGAYGIKQQFDGVEQLATWNDPTSDMAGATRVYSYLGNPNLLAAYLLPIIALSFSALLVWKGWLPKALAATMVGVNVCCLFFTQSRGGWLGLIGLGFTFLILSYLWWKSYLPPFWQKWLLPSAIASILIILLVGILFVAPLRTRVFSMFVGRSDSSNNFRINVWEGVKSMIRDRPILGIGPGNSAFNKIYPRYMQPKYSALSAYSIYLEILVETGIIGFSSFAWFLTVTCTQGIKQIQRLRDASQPQGFWIMAAIAGMVGLMIHGFVDTVWYRPPVSTLWWFLIAIIASQYANALSEGTKPNSQELADELN
ncbi:MAG: IctB family putative bicarbonate transporter [Microcystaceae cyanobacterium]